MIAIADLRDACGLAAGDTTYDSRLIALEAEAVAWVQRRTRRYFGAPAAVTERLKGKGADVLRLAEAPTVDPATVDEYAYVGATAETITAANDDGFEVVKQTEPYHTNEGWLERKSGYAWNDGYLYIVTYTRGYTETAAADGGTPADIAAPDDIRAVVKDLVRFRHFAQLRDPGLQSETIGGYSYTRGALASDPEAFLSQSAAARDTIRRWSRSTYA